MRISDYDCDRPGATQEILRRSPRIDAYNGPDAPLRNRRIGRSTIIGDWSYFRTGQLVPFASRLEMLALQQIAIHPAVQDIERNSEVITWYDGPHVRHHTPDYRVAIAENRWIYVEVKGLYWLKPAHAVAKYQRIAQQVAQRGQTYVMLTDVNLRQRARLRNAGEINAYGHIGSVCPANLAAVKVAISSADMPITIARTAALTGLPEGTVRPAIMHLCAWGDLRVNISSSITASTTFERT